MKNIAFLVYDSSLTGGAENITKQLCESLSEKYNVYLISLFQKNEFIPSNFEQVVVENYENSITKKIFTYSRKIGKIIDNNKIDLLFSVTAGMNSLAALSTCYTKIPWIFIEHSNLMNQTYGKKHYFRQWIGAKFAKIIVTLTEQDKKNYMQQFHINEECIVVIPNWFVRTTADVGYDSDSKIIMSAGRLSKVKGYDLLLKVASYVFNVHPEWCWEIYGDGDELANIKKEIDINKLNNNIFLKGNVKNLSKEFQGHAIFVLTSYYEGLPLVLLEAQSHNLPIISFDIQTGPSEIILPNENGYLIPAYDVAKMGEKIIELIENKATRISFSERSMEGLNKFDRDYVLQKWYNLLSNILE